MANPLLSQLDLPAPAKINHFLHITGRRADGYHLLQTLFQFLDFSDEISLTLRRDGIINRIGDNAAIPKQDDLVIKAAELLKHNTACQFGADIRVNKKIPLGGGLGGGSSDAATVLQGLNMLWQLGLDNQALATLGLRLGADVPVFVHGRSAWAEGVGEQLEPVELASEWYLVVHPGVHVSTAKIFSSEGLTRDCPPIKIATFLAGQTKTQNVFESMVRKMFPEVNEALNWLIDFGETKMTGSGACLFTRFSTKQQADQVLKQLPIKWLGFVAHSESISPLHRKLNQIKEFV